MIHKKALNLYSVYNIMHRRFKTASIIRGYSGFAGGEGT